MMQDKNIKKLWHKNKKKFIEEFTIMQTINSDGKVEHTYYERYKNMSLEILPTCQIQEIDCTGLKDQNGNLIFEGDILEWQCCDMDKGDIRRICKVFHDNKSDSHGMQHSRFIIDVLNPYKDNGNNTTFLPRSEKIKIIDNIYENPEVLEVPA